MKGGGSWRSLYQKCLALFCNAIIAWVLNGWLDWSSRLIYWRTLWTSTVPWTSSKIRANGGKIAFLYKAYLSKIWDVCTASSTGKKSHCCFLSRMMTNIHKHIQYEIMQWKSSLVRSLWTFGHIIYIYIYNYERTCDTGYVYYIPILYNSTTMRCFVVFRETPGSDPGIQGDRPWTSSHR